MITNDLIYVKSLETGVNYAINLRKEDDGAECDSYYAEFFFENNRITNSSYKGDLKCLIKCS